MNEYLETNRLNTTLYKTILSMSTVIFVGSFDPFTIGHDNIVRRALCLFDRLVIGVAGDNINKPYIQPTEQRIQAIKVVYDEC